MTKEEIAKENGFINYESMKKAIKYANANGFTDVNKAIQCEIKGLTILETYMKLLLDNIEDLKQKDLSDAITQLKHLEHYAHRTSGLWATDRPDLLTKQQKENLFFQLKCEAWE